MKTIAILAALTMSFGATAGPIIVNFTGTLTSLRYGANIFPSPNDTSIFDQVGDPSLTGHFYIDWDASDPNARVFSSLQFASNLDISHGESVPFLDRIPTLAGVDEFFYDPEGAYLRALDDQSIVLPPRLVPCPTGLEGFLPCVGNVLPLGFGSIINDATSIRLLDGVGTGHFDWETQNSENAFPHQANPYWSGYRGDFTVTSATIQAAPVPEPGSLLMFAAALGVLMVAQRRRTLVALHDSNARPTG